MEGMTESELVAFLGQQIHAAMNGDGSELSATRQKNLDYYLGEPLGNEREGYSSYRTREVLETVEWALPSLVRVFAGADNVALFRPVGPEDEQQAEQETDFVNDALNRQDDYFLQMFSWLKSALIDPVAYARAVIDERTEVVTESYSGLTPVELALLVDDPDVEITEQDSTVVETGDPVMPVVETFDVTVRRTIKHNDLRFEAIPGEEALVGSDCNSLNLDEASFVGHRTKKTYTWLVQAGYDRDLLDEVSPDGDMNYAGEWANRLYTADETWADNSDDSMRTYWVNDCSVMVDFDGDGIAERRHIVMIGDKIHVNEPDDYQPWVCISSVPMPHRHVGLCLADIVRDLELLKTTLYRQLLDNAYRVNRARTLVGLGALTTDGKTMEALLNPLSEYIPVEDVNQVLTPPTTSFVNELLPVIQSLTDAQQTRTGIAPNLSLDPKVIQQSTMGAFSGALQQASQRIELIARIIAETGYKWLIKKSHRLLKTHSQRPIVMKRAGQWVESNPGDWRDRHNVEVNLGSTLNNKEVEFTLLQGLLAMQKEALGLGLATPSTIYNTLDDLVTTTGRKSADRYFVRPDPNNPPQPPQDPALEVAKAQAQAMQMDAQSKIMRAQIEGQKAQLEAQKAQLEAERSAFEAQQSAAKAQHEAMLARMQAEADVINTSADTELKKAQTAKYLSEVRGNEIENDAAESGVTGFLEELGNVQVA